MRSKSIGKFFFYNRDANGFVELEHFVRKLREIRKKVDATERKRRLNKTKSMAPAFHMGSDVGDEDTDDEKQSDESETDKAAEMDGVDERPADDGGFASAAQEPWQQVKAKSRRRVPSPRARAAWV